MNLKQAKITMCHVLDNNPRQPIMLWGLPGIGKSEAVYQVAKERGMKVMETRLSQMDPVDIKGVPSVVDGKTRYNPPAEFPTESDGPTIWFLDEINAGARATMASAMQLVLDRRTGNYIVPDEVVIWAAGNETSHGAVANAMPSALANRFLHLEVEPDLDAFIDHGLSAGFDYQVLNFLRYRPDLLHSMQKGRDVKGFPSPRTWEFVSRQNVSSISSPELLRHLVQSAVGEGAAVEFLAFLEVFKTLPPLTDILANPNTADLPEEPSAKYMVVTALVKKATEANIDAILTYLGRIDREFMAMALQDILRTRPDLAHCPAITRWEIEHNSMI